MLKRATARRQRGLSIVELMVGVAIGLIVVAASAMLVSGQLLDNRRLLLETQIQQDLRAATDIVVRELRRAGARRDADLAVWSTANPAVGCNPYATVSAASHKVSFRYYRDATSNSVLGFELVTAAGQPGVLRSTLHTATAEPTACLDTTKPANWQDLTDSRTVDITGFTITPTTVVSSTLPCPRLCTGNTTACWPRIEVRELDVSITGESVSDPSVKRTMRAVVRLRNDFVSGDPALTPALCPP